MQNPSSATTRDLKTPLRQPQAPLNTHFSNPRAQHQIFWVLLMCCPYLSTCLPSNHVESRFFSERGRECHTILQAQQIQCQIQLHPQPCLPYSTNHTLLRAEMLWIIYKTPVQHSPASTSFLFSPHLTSGTHHCQGTKQV